MVKSDVCHFRHYIASKKIPNCAMFLCVWVETIDCVNWNSIAMLCHSIQFEIYLLEHSSDIQSHILNSTYKLWKDERQITDSVMQRFRVIRSPKNIFLVVERKVQKCQLITTQHPPHFIAASLHKTPLETVLLLNNRKVWIGIHKNIVKAPLRPPKLTQHPWSTSRYLLYQKSLKYSVCAGK